MEDVIGAFGGLAGLFLIGILIVLAVLWVAMPFYIVSIRNELRESNALLRKIMKNTGLAGEDLRKMQEERA